MIRSRGKFRIAVSDVPVGRCYFYGVWLTDGVSERCVIGPKDLTYRTLRSRFGDRIQLVGDGQDLPPLPVVPPPPDGEEEAVMIGDMEVPWLAEPAEPTTKKRKRRG